MRVGDAVAAYGVLKALKLTDMTEEVMRAVWHNMKALRPVAEEYEKQRKEIQESLYDEKKQSEVEELSRMERRMRTEGYVPTADEEKRMRPVAAYLNDFNAKYTKAMNEAGEAETEVLTEKVSEDDILAVLKANGKGFEDMEKLLIIIKGDEQE